MLKQLCDAPPPGQIQALAPRADDIENVLFESKDATMKAFKQQSADSQATAKNTEAPASALEEQASHISQESPRLKPQLEAFQQELCKHEAQSKHVESHALSHGHSSQCLAVAGQQTNAVLDELAQTISQPMNAQLANTPMQQEGASSSGSREPPGVQQDFPRH